MKRFSIKISNNDQNMLIPVRGIGNLIGYDDDVTRAVEGETESSINQETDLEVRRILPATSKPFTFRYWNGAAHVPNFTPIFGSLTAVTTAAYRNSFYVIQLFDTARDESQSKKHTGYLNGFELPTNSLSTTYTLGADREFTNLYVGQSVIDSMSGLTTDFYIKVLFYSAKDGRFYSFYQTHDPITSQERMYYKISINPNTLTWSFNPNYPGIEFLELVNVQYNEFINNTVQSITVEKPIYPSGNTFDNTGNYITI